MGGGDVLKTRPETKGRSLEVDDRIPPGVMEGILLESGRSSKTSCPDN